LRDGSQEAGVAKPNLSVVMRTFILLPVMLLLSAIGARADVSLRASRLEALSQIETGDNDRAVGGAGEVSRYQIKPWIWRLYSESEAYSDRRISTQVAEQHLTGLASLFRKRTRREPSDFDLYVLWNAGPTYYNRIGFSKSRVHPIIRDRARRYANLRQALDARLAQTAPPAKVAPPVKPMALAALRPMAPQVSSPILPSVPGTNLQETMFSLLPPTSQPDAPSPGQQPLFAVGGIQSK
jgi:hypothetical protein